ncbi:FlgO family outer membrane protein [Hydrogenophaga soli]
MKRRTFAGALTLMVSLTASLLGGCASVDEGLGSNLIVVNHRATDALMQKVKLDPSQPVLVATLVDQEDLGESSRLGRLFSEHIASRLASQGARVVELKLREQLFMKQTTGALLLSREVRDVSQSHNAQAVVVGTYTSSGQTLYVSLKLVRPEGNTVMAAHDYALPLNANIKGLLR